MITTKNKTIKSAYGLYNYLQNNNKSKNIWGAYVRPSYSKIRAWLYCEKLCEKLNGWGLSVLGAGSFLFSAGFIYKNKEDNKTYFVHITKSYDKQYCID